MVAMALFDQGSYISNRMAYPDDACIGNAQMAGIGGCTGLAPLGLMMAHIMMAESVGEEGSTCLRKDVDGFSSEICDWLSKFYILKRMANALHGATILASSIWLTSPGAGGTLSVHLDRRMDSQ